MEYPCTGFRDGTVVHDRGRVQLLCLDYGWHANPPMSWSGPRDNHDVLNHLDVAEDMCDALAS